mgnify:FL=1
MKAKEIRQMSDAEMEKRMKELKSELFNLRFQLATGQLDNPMRIKCVKKDIARIMTITKERAMSVQKEA